MRGYTLFELLVVLLLIASLAIFAPPLIAGSRESIEAKILAHGLEDTLNLARSQAIVKNRETAILFAADGRRYRAGDDVVWAEIPKSTSLTVAAPTVVLKTGAAVDDEHRICGLLMLLSNLRYDRIEHDPLFIEEDVGRLALDHLRRVIEELLRRVVLASEDSVQHRHAVSASEAFFEMRSER